MRAIRLMGALAILVLASACGTDAGGRPVSTPATDSAAAVPPPDGRGHRAVELTAGTTTVRGTLEDTPAGRDLAALLPLTVTVTDFHDTEKIGDLPRRLAIDEAPSGVTPAAGDIAYYSPWGNLALFYRDFAHSEGLVRLGRLDPGGAELLAGLATGTTITISPTS